MTQARLSEQIAQLLRLPEDQRNLLLARLKETNPEGYKNLDLYFKQNPGIIDETLGYEHWLKKVGAHTFFGEFSDFHRDLWSWYWGITKKQQDGLQPDLEDLTYLAIWGRGLGKSSSAEWLAICEGCLVGKGFVLYVCGTAESAEMHVEAIRDRLETEGTLREHYKGMRKPAGKGGYTGEHKQYGWRQDYLMTANSWAIRPVGLDKAIRGWKRGDARVSMIILDDVDDDDQSPEVILKNERRIAKKILPMGTARTKVVFAQNLIHSNSVLNRIHTRQTDILALRRGDVAIKAFEEIEIELQQTPRGPRNVIVKGTPTWPYIDMAECQSYLDRSGRDGFLAEYQHDFSGEQSDRVLPEYDDRVLRTNLITWSQFEAMYKTRRIPSDWPCDVGLDIGYTTGHRSAWTFLTKAPQGAQLTGSIFRYRGCVFEGVTVGAMNTAVKARLWPKENLLREFMSHEKLGEQMTLNQEHDWHFHPCDSAKTAGIAQWRHFLTADHSKPHPFHRDEKKPDGLWKIGCPAWFDIVDDDQFIAPRDDLGLKVHRDQAYGWKMRKVEETKSGMTVEQPMKANEDSCFVAGTKITTRYGENVIESIRPDDVVLTRQGWRKVLVAGKTSSEAKIWKLKLSNGQVLRGTSQHPIWVAGYGWKPLSELKAGERLLSLTECDSTAIQTQGIGRTEPILNPTFTPFKKVLGHFTSNFGSRFMAKFQTIMRFTIKTITRSIMPTPILNYSLVPSIVPIMGTICRPNSRSECEPISSVNKNWQRFGIEATKGENGIVDTPLKVSSLRRWLSVLVIIAARFMRAASVTASSAQPSVSRRLRTGWSTLKDRVLNAARLSPRLRSPASERVALHVREVSQTGRQESVYNLTVADASEYFANGILVHNCDATRMLTVAFGPITKSMTQAEKLQSLIPQGYHQSELAQRTDIDPNTQHLTSEMALWFARNAMKAKAPKPRDEFGNPLGR